MTIGERIQVHRKRAGLTLEELGQHVGVSRQAIHRMEAGQQRCYEPGKLYRMAKALGVRVEDLLGLPALKNRRQEHAL